VPDLAVFLLGTPEVTYQGHGVDIARRKALALLSLLAVEPKTQSRDALAALLWPNLDHEGARAALRSTLPSLTRLCATEWLRTDRAQLSLRPEMVWIDLRELRALLARARAHRHSGGDLCAECMGWLQAAVDLYRGPLLAGFSLPGCPEYELWLTTQHETLRREVVGAFRSLALAPGDRSLAWAEQAVAYARRWCELDPLAEEAHRTLMRLYVAVGLRTEALRQYKTCVALLDAELATPPEEETTRLAEQIRAGGAIGPTAQRAAELQLAEVLPPLPPLVIGREVALADLRARLGSGGQRRAVTVVQGWPGVGKSTTLALLARDPQVVALFPDGVLWASLGEQPGLLTILVSWAEAIGIAAHSRAQTIDELTKQLILALRDRRMLLIVDDIWHVQDAAPFSVGGRECAMLMTSRLNDVAQALAPTTRDIYRLAVLQEAAGVELLELLAPEAVAAYPDEARTLVHDLEGLPLAIQVAGRLLSSEMHLGWGISDLLDELHEGSRLLRSSLPGDMIDKRQDTPPTIAALLKRSTDALDPTTHERFTLLGLFVPKPATFDLAAMAAAWAADDPRPTARLLVNRGLLEPIGGGRFQMHALLVMHARSLIKG
jgi:DNA-binding SARP family transcriptional activator